MGFQIKFVEYHLPDRSISNDDISQLRPDWNIEKIEEKSGVLNRHICESNETAFDLAKIACDKLFERNDIVANEIDGIIFCTQSPDYIMPSNAFLIHKHLKLSTKVFAFDFNLACSGYVYGLAIAHGLMKTNIGKRILLINADTYSKFIHPEDRSTSILFGDAAAASILEFCEDETSKILDVILESSGQNFDAFFIPAGGNRMPKSEITSKDTTDENGLTRSLENIHMNGFGVWKFISRTVPVQIKELLNRNSLLISDVDMFIFHQASKLTLDSLVKALKIPEKKTFFNIQNIGNTVSASIPITLKNAENKGLIIRGDTVVLSGFGVGLSWGSVLLKY
ncbi:ketoacyl-ACP synthase III [Bacteroidota bacterium]